MLLPLATSSPPLEKKIDQPSEGIIARRSRYPGTSRRRRSEPLTHPRIEAVAQAVAQHVDRQDGDRQEHTGEQNIVREDPEQCPSLRHDVPPGRDLRWN